MGDPSSWLLIVAAVSLGVAAGVVFALAWRRFFPPGAQSRFWVKLSALTHNMLTADTNADFFSVYKALFGALGGYLGRNLAITAIGGAGLAAAWFLGLVPLEGAWTGANINPLSRWISDLALWLLAAFMASMTVGIFWPDKRRALLPPTIMQSGDFALLQINEAFKPLIRMVGNMETRRADLPANLTAPIFITGLARSGTTTVLNALTRSSELGSHQYRDFPFLGAPLTWSRLQGAIAKGDTAVERPHKDRILITKMSPEAYEEPLWQQFFINAHNPLRNQRLVAKSSNPKFEAFFTDHLRKILKLRGAARYVSKGNYNVGRIEFLARLFPDAVFVVPVREPVAHVASLVRQHELFTDYAKDDPRVPIYLAAAGHYEFGPQRRGICLTPEAAAAAGELWAQGDAVGYARQWAEVYGHVARLKAGPLADRILVVRYEDFCADPKGMIGKIIAHAGLADPAGAIAAFASEVSVSEAPVPAAVEAQRAKILEIAGEAATALGYGAKRPAKARLAPAT